MKKLVGCPQDAGCPRTGIDRRAVLRAGAGSVMAITLPLACGGGSGTPKSEGPIEGGNVSDLAVGAWTLIPNETIFLARDANGLFAMSSICTHLGCALPRPASAAISVTCPCHESKFDRNGAVVLGPATTPLPHYKVELTAGVITVQSSIVVASNTRTAVP
jgi:Rieske Fe-S protein